MSGYDYPGKYTFEDVTYFNMVRKETLLKIRHELELHESDIVLVPYPKSGTTWISQIIHAVDKGPEHAMGRKENLSDSYMPFIDFLPANSDQQTFYDKIVSTSPPRRIKSHLYSPFYQRYLQSDSATGPKFITIARNPKDTLVSYYYFHKTLDDSFLDVSWDACFEMFKNKTLIYGDVIDHHLSWWKYRNHRNVLFLQYEDLHADCSSAVERVAEFLGKSLTKGEVSAIVQMTSFKEMKARGIGSYLHDSYIYNTKLSPFFRSGVKGDWRHLFTEEQSLYVDNLVKRTCEPFGLTYTF